MEESPDYTVKLVRDFVDSPAASIPARTPMNEDVGEIRLAPSEFKFPAQGNPGTGSSGASA